MLPRYPASEGRLQGAWPESALDSMFVAFPIGKPPKSALADLGAIECRSRVNPRSVSTFPGNALAKLVPRFRSS